MTTIKPSMRSTETYTESNFLRLCTEHIDGPPPSRRATIEHFRYRVDAEAGQPSGWQCRTIVDNEVMSKDDAVFIARAYAEENRIPVIYESHGE
jgi:hypothetical protein